VDGAADGVDMDLEIAVEDDRDQPVNARADDGDQPVNAVLSRNFLELIGDNKVVHSAYVDRERERERERERKRERERERNTCTTHNQLNQLGATSALAVFQRTMGDYLPPDGEFKLPQTMYRTYSRPFHDIYMTYT
jgi:hypothetical protein